MQHCPSGLTSPSSADRISGGELQNQQVCYKSVKCVLNGSIPMTRESEINSPFAAHAEGHEGNAEDEEDDEGDNAHLWGCEPACHANHPNWSHFPLSASVKNSESCR